MIPTPGTRPQPGPSSGGRLHLSRLWAAGMPELPLDQRKVMSLPLKGMQWWKMCVTKQRSSGKGSAGCTASEITKRTRPCRFKSLKPPSILKEGPEQSVYIRLGNGYSHNVEGWELMASGNRRKIPVPWADVQLPDKFRRHVARSSVYSKASDQHLVTAASDSSVETDSCRGQRPPSELLP